MNETGEISCGNLPDSAKEAAGRGKMISMCVLAPLKLAFRASVCHCGVKTHLSFGIMLSFRVYLEYPMSHQL